MDEGLLSLQWNNHHSAFLQVLALIHRKDLYADVTLACDGKFYESHKLVLSTCSEYFKEMFHITQGKHPIIVLKDICSEDLECLLNYMYLGEVNVLQEKLPSLVRSAECLKIKGLATPDDGQFKNKRKKQETDLRPNVKKSRPSSYSDNSLSVSKNVPEYVKQPEIVHTNDAIEKIDQVKQEPSEIIDTETIKDEEFHIIENDYHNPSIDLNESRESNEDQSNAGSVWTSTELITEDSDAFNFSFLPTVLDRDGMASNANNDSALRSPAWRENASNKTKYCLLCSYSSADRSNFGKHLRVHTQEKPYSCHLCSYRSSHSSNMKRHYRARHFNPAD